MTEMNYAIILAGGIGSRFWPLSRYYKPKQFLSICSDTSMIEETVNRIRRLIPRNNIYIATNKVYHRKIKGCLKGLGIASRNIFFEPEIRNTLAPIGLLSRNIYNKDKESIILVFPCDHYIKDENRFLKVLNRAIRVAERGYIVCLGITPDRPETGYGYIKVKSGDKDFCLIDRFIEKPGLIRAREFIRDKRFYWNAGIFIFRANIMLEEIKRFALSDYKIITEIKDKKSLKKLWSHFTPVSIDYAVMEKTRRMALVPAACGWMDLGNWLAIERLTQKDQCGNIFMGNCIDMGSRNTFAWSDKRLLATLGLNDIIVVDTKDAILVCAKDKTQDVKGLVEILKAKKLNKLT